ncbi:Dbl homology domain-containing protein, partial [Martensiomyces pterosporus]
MLSPTAIDQQEAIHEIITTEQRYLHDLELIDAVFVQPLLAAPAVMPQSRAEEFLKTLFFNYQDLIKSSQALCAKLAQRQAESQVVERVGDIFLEWAEHDLCEFIEYSVHVPLAQAELEAELLKSKAMADFLKDAEAHPDARKLPIQSFIGRPATRFARYPLLLNAIIKRAPEGGDDVLLL